MSGGSVKVRAYARRMDFGLVEQPQRGCLPLIAPTGCRSVLYRHIGHLAQRARSTFARRGSEQLDSGDKERLATCAGRHGIDPIELAGRCNRASSCSGFVEPSAAHRAQRTRATRAGGVFTGRLARTVRCCQSAQPPCRAGTRQSYASGYQRIRSGHRVGNEERRHANWAALGFASDPRLRRS